MKLLFFVLLLLMAAGVYAFDSAEYADRLFSGSETYKTSDCRMAIVSETFAGSTRLNAACDSDVISLNGKKYEHGIGTHSDSHVRLFFSEPITAFHAVCGKDDVKRGASTAEIGTVSAGGKEVYKTRPLSGNGVTEAVDITFPASNTLELEVRKTAANYNSNHFDWADAKVTYASGRTVYIDEAINTVREKHYYPFSFTCGGRSSDTLLPNWKFEKTSRTLEDGTIENTYTYTPADNRSVIRAEVKCYKDTPALDWTLYFTNNSRLRSKIITDLTALNYRHTADKAPVLDSDRMPFGMLYDLKGQKESNVIIFPAQGSYGWQHLEWEEYRTHPQYLASGDSRVIKSEGLMSTGCEDAPYFTVWHGDSGIVCGMGWSASWTEEFINEGNTFALKAGLGDFIHTYLKAGESIRSPRILISFFEDNNMEQGLNAFRRAMMKHIIPKEKGEAVMVPIAYTVSAEEMNSGTEEIDHKYIEAARGLGFEITWFDAYVQRNGYPKNHGFYHLPVQDIIDPDRYPHGLEPLVEHAHAIGTDMMAWFAPEPIPEGSYFALEHPQLLQSDNGGKSGQLDMTRSEARAVMAEILTAAFKAWDIRVWKTDSIIDINLLRSFIEKGDASRRGIAENLFCQGLYAFWDQLREAKPDLLIDNCAGGGTRMDVELMSRSISLWRSDNNVHTLFNTNLSARTNQMVTANLNYYIPWSTSGQKGFDPYALRSGFNTGLSYVGNVPALSSEEREQLKQGIAECKRLRKYNTGNFYALYNAGITDADMCAWQLHRTDEADGYFVVFRREACPSCGLELSLREIDEAAEYKVLVYETYDLKETKTMKGSELKHYQAVISRMPGSLLVEYSKIK